MSRIINTAAECTVKQFMDCAFAKKHNVLLVEGEATPEELEKAFELIYSEYIDLSGLFITREFELSAYINSLWNRTQTIEKFIELQRRFVGDFGSPYIAGFDIVKKYGHKLYWDLEQPDPDTFLKMLDKMASREKKYQTEMHIKEDELVKLHKKRVNKEFTLLETRKQFITMLNRLQQSRYVINKTETTVEELAVMVADQKDQNEEERAQRSFKKK